MAQSLTTLCTVLCARFSTKHIIWRMTLCVLRYAILSSVFMLVLCLIFDQAISFSVRKDIYTDINNIPTRSYGIVLGTAKYVSRGVPNQFYIERLESAKSLFEKKKISYLLLSGDNRTKQYNEPRTMFRDLRQMGLPEKVLFRDYAGFRTLDSIIRADHVFRTRSFTIITQKFHCERALFIAKFYGINAICFAASSPNIYFRTRIREFFARLKVMYDLLIETQPHFLGSPSPLPKITNPVVELN